MNFRTTILLLVLVIAVGAVLYFTHDRPEKPVATDATQEHKLLSIDSANVKRLVITNSDNKRIVLEKTGSEWKLVEPVSAPAKTFEVDDLLRALTGLQTRGEVDASKKSSGGLDHPSFVVELTTHDGATTKLAFGDNSQVGDSLYVQLNDSAKPDVVGNSIYATLDKPASNYRETKLVSVSNTDIKQLAITNRGKTIKLEKTGDNWKIVEPLAVPAETSAVSDLLFGITNLNATEFIENPSAAAKGSLLHPRLTVWFSSKAPTTQPSTGAQSGQMLSFGSYQDILKKNVFVSLDGKETAVVPASSEKTFEKTPLDLRNKELITIDPDMVSNLTVAIDHPATTQPTTKPAELREFAIERRKIAPPTLGPELPATAPATTGPASTRPTTTPVHVAATKPAAPQSKWLFVSGGPGDAEEGQVTALLASFHPLRVEKYVEPETAKGSTYTLTLHIVPGKASESPHDDIFTFVDAGTRVVGTYKDAHFEVERSLIDKLSGDFKTVKVTPPPPPSGNRSGMPFPGHPPLGGGE